VDIKSDDDDNVLRRVVYLLSVSVAFNTLRTTRESTLTECNGVLFDTFPGNGAIAETK
jgi:hypothetical protein